MMTNPTILAAIISAAVSVLLTFLNAWIFMRNQRIVKKLEAEQAEQNARRDYEYEARKRLYHECEPLLFQLSTPA